MTYKERQSCIHTINTLRQLALNIHGVIDVVDNENCDKLIGLLEGEIDERDHSTKQVSLEEVTEYCNDRNIEMVARDWLDSLNDSLEKAVKIAKAYEESLEAFNARLEELEQETELLNADLKDGVTGVGMTRKCFEVRVKKELLRDVICFMEQAITEGSEEI